MSQFFDAATGWPLASIQERDRSQLPLWPELESELELALAAQNHALFGDTAPRSDEFSAPMSSASESKPEDAGIASPQQVDANAGESPLFKTPQLAHAPPALLPGEHRLDARAEAFPDADAELGQRLRAARERAELGRDELARRTRIAPTLIQAIEDGRFERLGARLPRAGPSQRCASGIHPSASRRSVQGRRVDPAGCRDQVRP